MLDLAAVIDRDPTRRPAYRRLLDEARSLVARYPVPPCPTDLPDGSGMAVLVIPAFMTGDAWTARLRRFLTRCGFRAYGWGLGPNWGPTPRLLSGLEQRVASLRRDHGPVALVGISLGGVLARNLAYDRPDDIRHVVTIASPFRLPTATTVAPLIRLCARHYSPDLRPARLSAPLPVPSTMIFTRDDGVVAWDSCRADQPGGQVFEVAGTHLSLTRNPEVLRTIVRRLARTGGIGT